MKALPAAGPDGIVALVPRTGGICKIGIATDPDELSTWRQLDGAAIRDRHAPSLPTCPSANLSTSTPEQTTRPAIDPVLEANHRAGSLFDTTASEPIEQFIETLRSMGSNLEATLAYAVATAGYPPPG